jgi:biopolymer transport protein ExbB
MTRKKLIAFGVVRRAFVSIALLAMLFFVPVLIAQAQNANGPTTAPATTAPAEGEQLGANKVPEETFYQLFLKGGVFMYPILAASVIAVAIIIERAVALRRGAIVPSGFLPGLKAVYRDRVRDREAALMYARGNDSSLARMVAAGIRRMTRGHVAVEKAIEDTGSNEALKLRRNLRVLYAIGSVATLLGLIGTISGMIKAFRVASGGGLGKSELLAKGIYEAMTCTFGGLAVAILVTIFYYYFVGRIERLVAELNDEVMQFAAEYIDDLPASTDDAIEAAAGRPEPMQAGGPLPEFSLARAPMG